MKKIGILFGMENTFPQAFIDKVNSLGHKNIIAEAVKIDIVEQGKACEYDVIIDRISHDVPFYRAYLKNAAISGTAVINNPFWWSADEKFFNNALAVKLGIPVPKTVLLPSNQRPDDTSDQSFKNLAFPLSWGEIFNHIGFPAYMKPHSGGGWKSVYKVENESDFFAKYNETKQLVMLLQEEIQFDSYFRCYCIGRKYVKIMQYEPRNPHHLRYTADFKPSKALLNTIETYVLALCNGLGYDLNTVEFAVRDGIPYAIDFCNPAPDADIHSVGQENFDWVVETTAKYAVEVALAHNNKKDNLTWGSYITQAASGNLIGTKTIETAAKTVVKSKIAKPEVKPAAKPVAKAVTKSEASKSTTVKQDIPKAAVETKPKASSKPVAAKKKS